MIVIAAPLTPYRGMPPAASSEILVAAFVPIEVARANAPPSLTMMPRSGGFVLRYVAHRMPDRGRKDIATLQVGQDANRTISEIRNCVMGVMIKLLPHT